MTTALMSSRQVFLALTIVDNDTMLARPVLSITALFFFVLSLYHHWLNIVNLFDALGMAGQVYLVQLEIITKAFWWGVMT